MLIVLVVLISFRLTLPFIVTRYVDNALDNLQGYNASFEDIDIHLIEGAYEIHNLQVDQAGNEYELPFATIPSTIFCVDWNALLEGAFTGEITFTEPTINFTINHATANNHQSDSLSSQSGVEGNWINVIRSLMPVAINRFKVNNGKVALYDRTKSPAVELQLHNLQLDALNMSNAKNLTENLPSRIYLQALSTGNGQLNVAMKFNPMKRIPDVHMDLRLENINMLAMNKFLNAYTNSNIEQGDFNVYAEVSVLEGNISGYVKPQFNNLKIIDMEEMDTDEQATIVWQKMVSSLSQTFRNPETSQFATRVAMQGSIAEGETHLLPKVWDAFGIAFMQAFDDPETISIRSRAATSQAMIAAEKKSKKEVRREKRQEKKRAKKDRKEKVENEKADRKSTKDNS
jgi:hypothetical protein